MTRIIQRIDAEKMDKARLKQEENRKKGPGGAASSGSLVLFNPSSGSVGGGEGKGAANQLVVSRRAAPSAPRPEWHAPWKLSAVVSAHLGWVRAIAFDPSNEWFVTGSADRTIKVWDLAKASAGADKALKLTLTGHINCIRGLAVSPRHPYLFSAAEDKKVMCWDLEYNRVVRHYHGHLSGVHCLALHPTLDILVTGGRDSVARVWDMRTKKQIHALGGHSNAVGTVATNAVEPQVKREADLVCLMRRISTSNGILRRITRTVLVYRAGVYRDYKRASILGRGHIIRSVMRCVISAAGCAASS